MSKNVLTTDKLINRTGVVHATIHIRHLKTQEFIPYHSSTRLETKNGRKYISRNTYSEAIRNMIINAKIRYNKFQQRRSNAGIEYQVSNEYITYDNTNEKIRIRQNKKNNEVVVYMKRKDTPEEREERLRNTKEEFFEKNKIPKRDKKYILKAIEFTFEKLGNKSRYRKIKTIKQKKPSKQKIREEFEESQKEYNRKKLKREKRKKLEILRRKRRQERMKR